LTTAPPALASAGRPARDPASADRASQPARHPLPSPGRAGGSRRRAIPRPAHAPRRPAGRL